MHLKSFTYLFSIHLHASSIQCMLYNFCTSSINHRHSKTWTKQHVFLAWHYYVLISRRLANKLALFMQANPNLHAGLDNLKISSNEFLPPLCSHSSLSFRKRDTNSLTSLFYHNIKYWNNFQLITHCPGMQENSIVQPLYKSLVLLGQREKGFTKQNKVINPVTCQRDAIIWTITLNEKFQALVTIFSLLMFHMYFFFSKSALGILL